MILKKTVLVGSIVLLLSVTAVGQSFFMQDIPADKMKLTFRYLHPDVKGDDTLTFLSGAYDASLSIPIGSQLNIVGAIPFAAHNIEGEQAESGIGNLYIGLEKRMKSTAEKDLSVSLGVFIPTGSKHKPSVVTMGLLTNEYEFFKFSPNTLTIHGNVSYHMITPGGLMLGFELGPEVAIPTASNEGDTELLVHYGFSPSYRLGGLALTAELGGICIITEHVDQFSDRFIHQLAFGVQWMRGSFRPVIFYLLYLKEYLSDIVNGVIGIKLDLVL